MAESWALNKHVCTGVQVLSIVDPLLREAGGLGSWQVISAGQRQCRGRVVVAASLADVQEQRYEEPTVLLVQLVGGEEEIPEVSCGLMCHMHRCML